MSMITKTKMQQFFGSVAAIIVLVLFVAFAQAKMGYRLPVFSAISDMMGVRASE
jgi:flagellar biogenesis protein FliO